MMIFIQCEFYMSSGGWEGKTFHLGNAPNFCTHPNLWFYPPQKLGVGNFTCLKQSNFGASFFMQSIFGKPKEMFGLKDKSNRERFDTFPVYASCEKKTVSRFLFECSDVFPHVLTAVSYFKFEMFLFCVR